MTAADIHTRVRNRILKPRDPATDPVPGDEWHNQHWFVRITSVDNSSAEYGAIGMWKMSLTSKENSTSSNSLSGFRNWCNGAHCTRMGDE